VQHATIRVEVDELGRGSLRSSEGAGKYLVDCLRQVVDHLQVADDAATTLTVPLEVTPLGVVSARKE
jgi:hypothetical protein